MEYIFFLYMLVNTSVLLFIMRITMLIMIDFHIWVVLQIQVGLGESHFPSLVQWLEFLPCSRKPAWQL